MKKPINWPVVLVRDFFIVVVVLFFLFMIVDLNPSLRIALNTSPVRHDVNVSRDMPVKETGSAEVVKPVDKPRGDRWRSPYLGLYEWRNLEETKELLKTRSVDAPDDRGRTMLMYSFGDPDVFDFLLKSGADVNAVAYAWEVRERVSRHERLVFSGNGDVVIGYGNRGPMGEALSADGRIKNRDVSLDSPLGDQGPTAVRSRYGRIEPSALPHARSGGESVLMVFIAEHVMRSARSEDKARNIALLEKLIERGADVNQTDVKGRTPLRVLAETFVNSQFEGTPELEILDRLLRAGAKVDLADDEGRTPLHCAVSRYYFQNNYEAFLQKLIESGADVNRKNPDGDTPLIGFVKTSTMGWFASGGQEWLEKRAQGTGSVIKLLLHAGSNVNATDGKGQTALMIDAANGCHLDVQRALVEGGARVQTKDPQGRNALFKVLTGEMRDLDVDGLAFLVQTTGKKQENLRNDGRTALWYGVYADYEGYYRRNGEYVFFRHGALPPHFVELLLKYSWTKKEKMDALSNARGWGDPCMENVELLLRHGADINARGQGKNILMNLVASGRNWTSDDIPLVSRLFKRGLDVNDRDEEGGTLLMMPSASQMDVAFLSFLLSKGADVRAKSKRGRTCMHVGYGIPCLERLIKAGADPRAIDKDGQTALFTVPVETTDVLAFLLSHGVDARGRSKSGKTPLLAWMERHGHPDGIRLLLDKGADARADDANNSPLMRAMCYSGALPQDVRERAPDRLQYVSFAREFLKRGGDPNLASPLHGQTPLVALSGQPLHVSRRVGIRQFVDEDMTAGFKEALFALFDYGADVDARDEFGRTAWDYVKWKRDPLILGWLKEAVKRTQYPQPSGLTPLMRAAGSERTTNLLLRLLEEGIPLAASDGNGWTALTHAAWSNPSPGIVRFLIERGADVNHQDALGKTPLMRAVWHNSSVGVVRVLLENGAHPGLRDRWGNTVVDIAIAHDVNAGIFGLLLDAGAKFTDRKRLGGQMLRAVCSGTTNPEALKVLLKKGVKVDERDEFGQTALMKAVSRNPRADVVKVLLDAGADVNAKGISVLDYTFDGNPEVYRMLVAKGLDLEEKSAWWTPEEKALMQRNLEKWGSEKRKFIR